MKPITIGGIKMPVRCVSPIWVNGIYAPCGKCRLCRKRLASQWSFRISQECEGAYVYNVLVTYDEQHVPFYKGRMSLNKVHFSDMMKRFRENVYRKFGARLRFFCVGEYGGHTHRPHYHVILFSDKNLHAQNEVGLVTLEKIQDELTKAWRKGYCGIKKFRKKKETDGIGAMARYMTQYMLAYQDDYEYSKNDKPFRHMSRRPAIGYSWLETHGNDISKMQATRNYRIFCGHDLAGNEIWQQLPPYYKRKIMSEEEHLENSNAYKEYCREFNNYLQNLNFNDYENRKQAIKRLQEQSRKLESDEYRKRKVHSNNECAAVCFETARKTR